MVFPRLHSQIRGLAWVAVKWAQQVRPNVICLENVEEFVTWGPLDDSGQPIKARSGETFDLFIWALRVGWGEVRGLMEEIKNAG